MTTNYSLGDFLIRVKNAALAGKREVVVPQTKLVKSIAEVLKKLGFVEKVETKEGNIIAYVAFKRKKSVLINLKLVTKPGLRIYMNVSEIKARKKGASMLILSTPAGIVSSLDAVKKNVGGEVIAEVW